MTHLLTILAMSTFPAVVCLFALPVVGQRLERL